MTISCWIPFVIVDAVQYPIQIAMPGPQQSVKFFTKFRCLNFDRVSRTHRGYRIGKDEPGLQSAGQSIKLDSTFSTVDPVGKSKPRNVVRIEKTMKCNVVNGEQGLCVCEVRIVRVNGLEICGDESRHPIVEMDDIDAFPKCFG